MSWIGETSDNSRIGNQVDTDPGSVSLSFVCANLALCCIQKNKQMYHAYKMDKLQLPANLAENLLETAQQAETLLRKKNLGSIISKSCSEYGFLPRKMWHKLRSLKKLPLRGNNLLLRPSSAGVSRIKIEISEDALRAGKTKPPNKDAHRLRSR